MAELTDTDIRERVRDRYAAAARSASSGNGTCCGPDMGTTDKRGNVVFGPTRSERCRRG